MCDIDLGVGHHPFLQNRGVKGAGMDCGSIAQGNTVPDYDASKMRHLIGVPICVRCYAKAIFANADMAVENTRAPDRHTSGDANMAVQNGIGPHPHIPVNPTKRTDGGSDINIGPGATSAVG